MSRAVGVTGLGAVTPLGADVTSTWSAVLDGRSAVRLLDGHGFDELPVRLAAPVRSDPAAGMERATARRLDRYEQLAMTAAAEAWRFA